MPGKNRRVKIESVLKSLCHLNSLLRELLFVGFQSFPFSLVLINDVSRPGRKTIGNLQIGLFGVDSKFRLPSINKKKAPNQGAFFYLIILDEIRNNYGFHHLL